ncbi:MAG TPA: hypothetical protein VNL35_09170 [Chloroflexota bacterium]|nr:hypothetical protein [Chloroflexota bacterium]
MMSVRRRLRILAGCALAAPCMLVATQASHAASGWSQYHNKASRYTISYPLAWTADHSHKDGTDFSVQSSDGEAYVGVVAIADSHPSVSLQAIDLGGLKGGGKMVTTPTYKAIKIHGIAFEASQAFEKASTGEELSLMVLTARHGHKLYLMTAVVAGTPKGGPTHPAELTAATTMLQSMNILG